MITLPLTCNQILIGSLSISFIIGMSILLTQSWYPFNFVILIGIALVGLPVFSGFLLLCTFIIENVRCKCK